MTRRRVYWGHVPDTGHSVPRAPVHCPGVAPTARAEVPLHAEHEHGSVREALYAAGALDWERAIGP
jgi:hypothetical protein